MKALLLGKNGQVGWELQRALVPLADVCAFGSGEVDLTDLVALRRVVREIAPDTIVNAAAYTAVDKAESASGRARRLNAEAVGVLAEEASRLGAWLVHYSSDYVFDGSKPTPYVEDDPTNPLSVYGRTKLEGENAIRDRHDRHLIFRTSWVYATRGSNFAKTMLRLASERDSLKVVADQYGAPTSAELIADITALTLHTIQADEKLAQAIPGTYHLAAAGETTWYDYARYVLGLAIERGVPLKCAPEDIEPITTAAYPVPAKRPKSSRMDTSKLRGTFDIHLPDWRFHVMRLVEELSSAIPPWHVKE